MELFTPSKKILEAICLDEKPMIHYSTVTPQMANDLNPFMSGLLAEIAGYYRFFPEYGGWNTQVAGQIANEIISNAYNHGPKGKPIEFSLFLGKKGICYGVRDEGKFFKRKRTKEKFEKKSPITKFDKNDVGGHRGGINRFVFPYSDMIEVDTSKGILYCVLFKKRLKNRKF